MKQIFDKRINRKQICNENKDETNIQQKNKD